ncbi:tetratricopeptide repeat-containing sulfotransferase family protein [Hyphococcus sp.]|uniref:tetratricopeptide repeat-containing sulfotransferase family protein n=1 Tax=Hyphococcus sp. TaxID=2038636 RepID=UPI0035C6B573
MASLQEISELISSRDLKGAAAALHKLARKPNRADTDWSTAMRLSSAIGDQETTLAFAQGWLAQSPADPRRMIAVIEALSAVSKYDEAAKMARRLQDDPLGAADAYYFQGVFAARHGRRDEALARFRQALKSNPKHTPAWEQIALLNGYDDFNADLDAMMALANQPLSPALAIPLCYALGRAFDHTDDIDKAFQWFSQGGAIREKATPYDIEPYLAYIERLRTTFTPELINHFQNDVGGENIIVVLGAPRSGSTLIEQILATTSGVTPTGEHMLFRMASLPLGSMEPPDMARAADFTNKDWRQMAQTYLLGLRKRFGPARFNTEKSMLNATYAGLMRILMPQAKFIWCDRDLKDTAWSCFRSHINANRWAQKHETCAQYLLAHQKLKDAWANAFGDAFINVSYEGLVQQPEETTQRLFDHAGVERPENWRSFYESDNPVATASLSQVRQPLNEKPVGSWRRYEKFLAPVYERYFGA